MVSPDPRSLGPIGRGRQLTRHPSGARVSNDELPQVDRIRHWTIIQGTWDEAPDIHAHWHIDPPYNNPAGRLYPCNQVDYLALENWCRQRRGFVQVCENDGATWLPFKPFSIVKTHRARGYSVEALYEATNCSRPHGRSRTDRRRHGFRAPAGHRAASDRLAHGFVGRVRSSRRAVR